MDRRRNKRPEPPRECKHCGDQRLAVRWDEVMGFSATCPAGHWSDFDYERDHLDGVQEDEKHAKAA